MPKFAANATTLYTEYDFEKRFAAAAQDGFKATEFLFPYEYSSSLIARLLKDAGLQQVLLNAPPGDWAAGERGTACLPGRGAEFRTAVHRALAYAEALQCPRVHIMAGVRPQGADPVALYAIYTERLAWAAEQALAAGREILIEPINANDMPGYLLNRQAEAHSIVAEIGLPNLKVQMDLYHCSRVEGDVVAELQRWLGGPQPTAVGHIQIAGIPGRHEPDSGTLEYGAIFDLIDHLGFSGYVGLEYFPKAGTSAGLDWLRERA